MGRERSGIEEGMVVRFGGRKDGKYNTLPRPRVKQADSHAYFGLVSLIVRWGLNFYTTRYPDRERRGWGMLEGAYSKHDEYDSGPVPFQVRSLRSTGRR